jgi:tetratricopeptide (TPR) repeat protein
MGFLRRLFGSDRSGARPASAERAVERPTDMVKEAADEHRERGRSRLAEGRFEEALAELDEALRLDPDDTEAEALRSKVVSEVVNAATFDLCGILHPEARPYYGKSQEIDPKRWGDAMQDLGRYAEACEKYANAAEIDPRDADAYVRWGCALGRLGRHEEACEKFARAGEINPRYVYTYLNWAGALRGLDRYAEACEKYAKAVALYPRFSSSYMTRQCYISWGVALAEMGKEAEACEKFSKAIALNPWEAEAYYRWGVALGSLGRHAEACEKFAKAVELDPGLKPRFDRLRKHFSGKK